MYVVIEKGNREKSRKRLEAYGNRMEELKGERKNERNRKICRADKSGN